MIRFGDVYIAEDQIAAVYPSKTEEEKVWVALKCGRSIYCSVEMLEVERALADAGLLRLADLEPGDMTLIVLEDLADAGFLYIARDENGALFAYEGMPIRGEATWQSAAQSAPIPEPVFQGHVSWEDAEPSDVHLLLEEARLDRWQFA